MDSRLRIGGGIMIQQNVYGTINYNYLENKPSINGVVLSGNRNSVGLGIVKKLTQAQYNSLPSSKNNDNVIYLITG